MATTWNGILRSNEIFSSIYNMIISQQVFADPIKGTYDSLARIFKTDGSLYGSTKLFYSIQLTDVQDWRGDSEASQLLNIKRPADPFCQAVVIDTFKKVWLTVDNFLSKRAWGNEGVFSQFNSVILGTIRDTKRIYEATMVNAFVGTEETSTGNQSVSITLPTETGEGVTDEATPVTTTYAMVEELNRLSAQTIAEAIANLMVNVKDVNADYNDLQYMRSYDLDDLIFVWNAEQYNKITKLDLPTIFHNDNLIARLGEHTLPSHYFGNVNDATKATADANTRALVPQTITISGVDTYFIAGQAIPVGTSLVSGGVVTVPSYQVDPTIVCKIIHKDSVKFMSAFETETEFWNPRSLTSNHYLIFGHSSLNQSRLFEYPWITVRAS